MKIGNTYKTSCPEFKCTGFIEGVLGGKFYVGERKIEYTQILNCKCDTCGLSKPEVFEVWDEYENNFYISDFVTIPLSDDSEISFPGLGMPATQISPQMEYFLRTGIKKEF